MKPLLAIAICLTLSKAAVPSSYPIKASANGRYYVDANGNPFLLLADCAHSLIAVLTPAEMATYFSDRESRGFNASDIFILCDSSIQNCHSDGSLADGTRPFTSGTSPQTYDLSTPNPAYWSEIDALVSQAASYNLIVLFDPLIESSGGPWMQGFQANGNTKVYNFGAYLANRYKGYSNIEWRIGNDFQDWSTSSSDNTLVHQFLLGIKSADTSHLFTTQLNYDLSYSNEDTLLGDVVTDDGCYTYYETYDCVLQAYTSSPTLPIHLDEANYEGANNTGALSQPANTYTLREQEYWTMTSGGKGQIWGNDTVHHFDAGWQAALGSPGALEIPYFIQLFSQFDWWDQVPDTAHQVVTAGYGTYNGSNLNLFSASYCTTSWITNGTNSLMYCPASTTLTVNLSKFSGSVRARWYDPSAGTFLTVSGSPFANSGSHNFTTPGANHDGDHDWLLLLDMAGTAPNPPTNLVATPH